MQMTDQAHIVADIGGTNARFALVSTGTTGDLELHNHARFRCADYPGLSEVFDGFIDQAGVVPDCAGISIAGPADTDHIRMTNLNWSFSISEFKRKHGLNNLWVINDAAAGALATTRLKAGQLECLRTGETDHRQARINLIPGTGFGVGAIMPVNGGWVPLQGEGGHAGVSAVEDIEFEILRRITSTCGRAIGDAVLSGPGMHNIYLALCDIRGVGSGDIDAPEMTRRALENEDPTCIEAMDIYIRLFGRFAGDLALTLNAHGGVYLSGSLLMRIGAPRLKENFNKGFEDKGLQKDKVSRIPVQLVNRDFPGLLGAAVWLESNFTE